ncbi:hypothetical protein GLAREA_03976 [Glarea lozoyensis ATCC 20868]|uniref:Glycoside hydrolase 131 catalytic N-terminal domain-containing protein n=2 Tax=Glarea lozoyensis TaxID=101852 RepID=S3D1G5_GLAL2|nr:uncharacterized protein GLAREA_03976 [Glarea lozoyensis ATCC 20868]EHL02994.1 hypothetical protein M7I_0965 [Glarea lozoyensis 74030]EPE31009.1 hypothetical protein GLAREA_03976 [Glarea lozoyensis ATCC 20868]
MYKSLFLASFANLALGGTILWDGRFNDMTSGADLSAWSFSNPIGSYQYYIHGDSEVSSYVNLDSTFKNPADTGSAQGVKITLDSTAHWNGQPMRRTELIPQTSAAINKGTVYYHFSMQRSETNAPSESKEHQIAFFESHFTEMKSGWQSGAAGTSDPLLRWNAGGSTQWNTTWEAGVWHNVAYEINFDAGSVAFYHSTGAEDLVLAHEAVAVTASSDGKDWHVGVLELPRDGFADENEDVFFSGVYIESGELTTSVSGPGGVAAAPAPVASSSAPVVVVSTATVIPVAASTSAPAISTPVSSAIEAIPTPAQTSSAIEATPTSAEPSTAPETLPTIPITFTLPSFSNTPTTLATLTRSSSISSITSVVPESTSITTPEPTATPAPEEEDEDEDCEYEY